MPKTGEPSGYLPPSSDYPEGQSHRAPCVVLTPSPKAASRWDGALRSRLKRAPLEAFLRQHSQCFSNDCRDPVTEGIELATLFIIAPAIPHRVQWRALSHAAYWDALGQAIAGIACGTGNLINEPRLWRVAALRTMGRLLTPVLGIDMAASVTAAAIATMGFEPHLAAFDEPLDQLAATAVGSGSENDLFELRRLVGGRLASIAERGAAKLMAAPTMVTISAEPPSNH